MTVLIIGGAYQGKRKVAENLYADLPRIENLHEIVRKMLKEDKDPLSLADTLCGQLSPAMRSAAASVPSTVRTKTGVKRLVVCAVLWHRKQTQSCA